jgi:hypothetical protein
MIWIGEPKLHIQCIITTISLLTASQHSGPSHHSPAFAALRYGLHLASKSVHHPHCVQQQQYR